jgi:hypothetical protein
MDVLSHDDPTQQKLPDIDRQGECEERIDGDVERKRPFDPIRTGVGMCRRGEEEFVGESPEEGGDEAGGEEEIADDEC